ncbi:hypothetical protein D3C72_1399170 [compost metagenome]
MGAVLLGALHRLADVLDARQHGRQRDELGIERVGHQPRQRGLAHAGWTPQDHRMRLAGGKRHAQRLAGPQQVLLADDLVDGARAQAFRQRLPGTFRGVGKQRIRHDGSTSWIWARAALPRRGT